MLVSPCASITWVRFNGYPLRLHATPENKIDINLEFKRHLPAKSSAQSFFADIRGTGISALFVVAIVVVFVIVSVIEKLFSL